MLVSCICVCHNKPDTAAEAIQSIIDQSYPHWEALVVDSGVLFDAGYYDRFGWRNDRRVRLIRSTETQSIRRSRAMAPWCFNECFRKGLVSGELVLYLCDDDIFYPHAFETFVAYRRCHPQAQAMYASQDIGVIYPSGRRAIIGERRAIAMGGRSCNGRQMDCEVDYLQFCHTKEVLSLLPAMEYWPEEKPTASHADGLFMERIGEHVPIHPIDVKVSQNRRTPESIYAPLSLFEMVSQGATQPPEAADWQIEALNWRQQYLLNQSYLQSLAQSSVWKLLKPIRTLRRLLRPRGFDARALIPWNHLEEDPEGPRGTWIANGPRPYFLVPCELPAGRLRIRIRLASDKPGRLEILAQGGNGISDVEPLFQTNFGSGLNRVETVCLTRPALGVQINPLGGAGRFQLELFEIVPLSGLTTIFRSLGDKCGFRRLQSQATLIPSVLPDTQSKEILHYDDEYPDLQISAEAAIDWSVVIPTINDVDRVVKCITSCRRYLEHRTKAEFIVVDDGTRDLATVQQLTRAAADLGFRLLCNHQNLGFSASVNHGMCGARGRFVALCNNDIVFRQPCLEALARAFAADPSLGVLGARLLYPSGNLQHAGMDKVPGLLHWHHAFHDYPGDHPAAQVGRYVWSVTGALMALRRETLQRLGGLSTAYALAYEDADYCLHAWANGIRVGYCAEAVAIHEECGTRGSIRRPKEARPPFWAERERAGAQYFKRKWAPLRDIESFESVRTVGL
jgi:GT2 family glycosyltransferase